MSSREDRFFCASPIAMYVSDTSGHVLSVNQAALNLFLIPASDEADIEFTTALADHCARIGRSPGTVSPAQDVELKRSDSTIVLIRDHVSDVLDDQYDTVHLHTLLIIDRDIAGFQANQEHSRTLAELSARRFSAEAVVEAQKSLLATVSHELRNPIHAVQGLAELLNSENLPRNAAFLASSLARQLHGLADLTSDLLDAASIDAGSVVLTTTATSVPGIISEIVEYGRAAAGDRPLTLKGIVSENVPTWVSVDRSRLRQILRNLIGNAVKFTRSGTITISVTRDSPQSDVLSFSVVDCGVGIPRDEIDRILEPFATASTAGRARGAGLGLSIVHRLIAAMGGSLHIESNVGVGSRFVVELGLPEVDSPLSLIDLRPAASVAHRENFATDGLMVLVVEDNPVNQQLAQAQLERLGMIPIIVGSGEDALNLLAGDEPPKIDAILMDLQLPGIDGIETTRRIRDLKSPIAKVRIVGLSAAASPTQRADLISHGMDTFVAKPATLDDIKRVLSKGPLDLSALERVNPQENEDQIADVADVPFDPSVIVRLVEEFGERSIVDDLIDTFLRGLPTRRDSLIHAFQVGDFARAKQLAHTLRSSAGLLGATSLRSACASIEAGEAINEVELEMLFAKTESAIRAWDGYRA